MPFHDSRESLKQGFFIRCCASFVIAAYLRWSARQRSEFTAWVGLFRKFLLVSDLTQGCVFSKAFLGLELFRLGGFITGGFITQAASSGSGWGFRLRSGS